MKDDNQDLKILLVSKQNKLGLRLTKKLEKHLSMYTKEIYFDLTTAVKFKKRKALSVKKFNGDIIITIGGDGTLLRTAMNANVPILPVKIEGHGFLCTCSYKELKENIGRLANRDFEVIEKLRLKASKLKKTYVEKYVDKILHKTYPYALNEIVFARKRPSKILGIELTIDNITYEFIGDGLLISTPSGSTAYGSSAGGSLIDPSLKVIEIIPLYPFFSNIKPIIIPSDKKIFVKITKGECALIIDGHSGDYFRADSEFVVELGKPLKLISLFDENFYEKVKKEFYE